MLMESLLIYIYYFLFLFLFTFFFHFLFEFYIGEEWIRAWWIILREERECSLHWFYIGVCTWLYNMCLVCNHWYSMENGGMPIILSICFESMKTSNLSMWHLREMHNSLIDYYCILSWNKSSSKKLIYFIIHSSFFVRAWVRICRGNIHVWERQFQLKVSWNGITKAWIWKYIAYRRRSVWDGRKYNFKNCKKIL
jgi:hypothetical protein